MIGKVRKFIRNSSPDWLNVEVNKDFFTNFSAALTPDHESEELVVTPRETRRSRSALGFATANAERLPSLTTLLRSTAAELETNSELPPPTSSASSACTDFPFQGKPHWRRIKQVFEALEQAETGTYTELINYVRATTGTGCSRKLISKWKKVTRQNNERAEVPAFSNVLESNIQEESETRQFPSPSASLIISEDDQSQEHSPTSPHPFGEGRSKKEKGKNISPFALCRMPFALELFERQAWSYLAVTAIVAGVVGFDWLNPQSQSGDNSVRLAVAQEAASPSSPVPPKPLAKRSEPRNIKISLTLSSRQDLKVKQGDKVIEGQVLSDRTSERSRLLARKKQLELSLEKLNLPLPPITPSKPIPALSKLPPVSYQEEEANIKLKHQELGKAEKAYANQEEKIKQIRELARAGEKVQQRVQGEKFSFTSSTSSAPEASPASQHPPLELIIEHEQAVLKNLQAAKQEAQIQLELAQSKLTTAKENRAYSEYQRQLEETRRALAIEQQQLELERQRANRAQQLTEREYSLAQIAAQIQEIDAQISQLGTVKAPYEGTIKKVKWTGQSNHALSVELTLAVLSMSNKQ